MFSAASANNGAVFSVCYRGDGAGVDNVAVAGILKSTYAVPLADEKLLHGLGFVLIYLASKGIKAEFHCYFHQIIDLQIVYIVKSVN